MIVSQRKTPRSALRKGDRGAAGAGGGRRKISFAAVPEEDEEDEEAGDEEDADPIEDPDLAAPASSAEARTGHCVKAALQIVPAYMLSLMQLCSLMAASCQFRPGPEPLLPSGHF